MNKEINSIGINKKPSDTTVVVAMSGGVDSSTVAGMELTGTGGSSTDAGAYVTMNIPRPYESSRYKMWEYKASKQEQNDYFIHQSGISSWVGGTNAFTAIKFYAHDYSGGGSHGGINGEVKLYGLKGKKKNLTFLFFFGIIVR